MCETNRSLQRQSGTAVEMILKSQPLPSTSLAFSLKKKVATFLPCPRSEGPANEVEVTGVKGDSQRRESKISHNQQSELAI